MKLHLIGSAGVVLLLIGMFGCLDFSTANCINSDFHELNATVIISLLDKQTGQPVTHGSIDVTMENINMVKGQTACVPRVIIVEEAYQTDISSQITFTVHRPINYEGDGVRLKIRAYKAQYEGSSISWNVFPGINDINIELLNNSNQP